jgi:Cu(I)/Ag(I) efflux system membrane fusion protein
MKYKRLILVAVALVVASGLALFVLRAVSPDRAGLAQSAVEDTTHTTHDEQSPGTVAGESAHEASNSSHEDGLEGYAPVELDAARVQAMGIKTERVTSRVFTRTLRTVGIVEVDETRVAHVQTKFEGWIEELHVDFVGKPVRRGQPLFSVYSPDLVASQEEYLLAIENAKGDRDGPMAAELERWSKSMVAAARKRLARWDIPDAELARVEREAKPLRALTFNSPVDGTVLKKTAVRGMNVEPGMDMFEIADLSAVWVQADVYEQDLAFVRTGQAASLSLDAMPGRALRGRVEFINPVLDQTTRTAKVRFAFENAKGLLMPGMYATVELGLASGGGLAVPEEAVIDTGEQKIVFVADGPGRYVPRVVELGAKMDRFYAVVSGLREGDEVATSAQFLLDSESRLKAAGGGAMAGHAGMGKDDK